MTEKLVDWNGQEVDVRFSRGRSRVPYVEDWTRNVIGVSDAGAAPGFLVRQVNAYVANNKWFGDDDAAALATRLNRVSKFQSIRSEDALTWSWFGTLSMSGQESRRAALQWVFDRAELEAQATRDVLIRQWIRVAHPHFPGRTGPEVDAVLDDPGGALIYVEAKWEARLGTGQGATAGARDDQIVLRRLALRAGAKAARRSRAYAVLGVSRAAPRLEAYAENVDTGQPVEIRWLTWQDLAQCSAHPYAQEFQRYLTWKERLTG